MIREANANDEALLLRLSQSQPVVGPLVEMHWHIAKKNPRMPFRFFLVGDTAVLKTTGPNATLCGVANDPEELAGFLAFCGARRLTALNQSPAGWHVLEKNLVMLRAQGALSTLYIEGKPQINPLAVTGTPKSYAQLEEKKFDTKTAGESSNEKAIPCLDLCPPANEVLAVLEAGSAGQWTADERDGFYADLCARRNHGFAAVYGIRNKPYALAATAGIYALTQKEGYIACVETRPACQNKGYATALLRRLIHNFGARTLSLLCAPELAGFYTALEFTKTNQMGCVSTPTKDETNT